MNLSETIHGKVALEFAQELAQGNFDRASSFLSDGIQDNLEQEFNEMIGYGDGPVMFVEVMNIMEDWPDKKENDVGWAYVALAGDSYAEAVTVIISNFAGSHKISSIEWGRP